MFLTTRNVDIVLEFCKELLDWDKFNEVILIQCLSYCEAVVQQGTQLADANERSNFEQILQFLCELSLKQQPITVLPGQASPCEKLCLVPCSTRNKTRSKSLPTESVIAKKLGEVVDHAISQLSTQSNIQSLHTLWASLICLSHYRYDLYHKVYLCISSSTVLVLCPLLYQRSYQVYFTSWNRIVLVVAAAAIICV